MITCRRGNALHCVMVSGRQVLEMAIFSTSQNKNPLTDPIIFLKLITMAEPPSRRNFIMIGREIAAPHMGEVVGWRSIFPVTSRASEQPTPSARVPHIIHQSTRFRPRMYLLGVSSIRLIPWVSNPKNPSFGDVNGDFQLKRLRAYLGAGETYHDA
jgi:hypothetical protein